MSAKEPKDIMSSLLKIVPQLGEEGFDTWLMALRMAAFHYDWFDPEKYPDDDWTPAEMKMEDRHKTQVQNRKTCYTIMYQKSKGYEHLYEDVKIGDAGAGYKAVCALFDRATTSGFIAAQKKFHGTSMMTDHCNITKYMSIISKRAKHVISKGGAAGSKEKIAVLKPAGGATSRVHSAEEHHTVAGRRVLCRHGKGPH